MDKLFRVWKIDNMKRNLNQRTKANRLKKIARELHEMFPGMNQVELTAYCYDRTKVEARLTLHGHRTYASATETMRELGVGVRNKTPYAPSKIGAYTQLEGSDGDGLKVTTYPDELPPCCHIEKVVERIPKTEIKDTGEFIEVERVKVVCPGNEQDGQLEPSGNDLQAGDLSGVAA